MFKRGSIIVIVLMMFKPVSLLAIKRVGEWFSYKKTKGGREVLTEGIGFFFRSREGERVIV